MVRYITENEDETIYEPSPTAYLVLIVNGRESQSFPLRGTVHIGRDKSNSVVVADHKVSRHHAMLVPVGDSYILSDQGSANGTYLNGVLISQPTRLKLNDKVGVGDTTFMFTTEASPDLPKPVPEQSVAQAGVTPALAIPPDSGKVIFTGLSNRPIWTILGCMGLLIIALLLAVAVLVGLLLGRGQGVSWLLMTAVGSLL